jgi:hypothetical protein
MSSKDDSASSPPMPLPLLPPCQTDAVKEIMAKVVSTQSANKYAGQNSMFALFCYESAELRNVLLELWFIDGLSMHAKENAEKKYAKTCCMIMCPEDNNCPFILSNLTFVHFSNFIMQKRRTGGKVRGRQCALETCRTSSLRVRLSISST